MTIEEMTDVTKKATEEVTKVTIQRSFATREVPGTLYLVATPIGNLEDMTFRAIRTLKEVQLIAAEDTRQTRKLLTHYEVQNRLVSYHEHNKEASGPELIRMLVSGDSIALVSDAGIPAISDPGAELVSAAVAEGIPVVPIPGANAALSALIISGLPTDRFLFLGFPPRERKNLNKWLDGLEHESGTILMYESPHRIKKTLAVIAERWSTRKVAVIREITKRHEEAIRGTVAACLSYVEETALLGECCIVIEGFNEEKVDAAGREGNLNASWWSSMTLEQHVNHYEMLKMKRKEAMKSAAVDRGLSRRDVYQALLNEQLDVEIEDN